MSYESVTEQIRKKKDEHVNLNTFVGLFITAMVCITGYLARTEFEEIKRNQESFRNEIMPRQEIEAKLRETEAKQNATEAKLDAVSAKLIDLQERMVKIEVKVNK